MTKLVFIALGVVGLGALVLGGWYAYIRSLESPKYVSVVDEAPFELRDYPALVAAEVERTGTREAAVQRGFRPLAQYIFAKERTGASIAMTTPVTQRPTATTAAGRPAATEARSWSVRFIMPAQYAKATLPAPAGTDVRLVDLPPQRVAAIRFGGRADDALFDAKERALLAWVAARGLRPSGPATLAYYDDPSIPGFLRRNEVLVPVSADQR